MRSNIVSIRLSLEEEAVVDILRTKLSKNDQKVGISYVLRAGISSLKDKFNIEEVEVVERKRREIPQIKKISVPNTLREKIIEIVDVNHFQQVMKQWGYIYLYRGLKKDKIHSPWCGHLTKERFITSVITNERRYAQYFYCENYSILSKWSKAPLCSRT